MKERRQRIQRDAHAGDAKANELLDYDADRVASRRNVARSSKAAGNIDDGTAELCLLYDSAVNASHVRKYVADHPDSRPGVGWFTAVVTPELLQKLVGCLTFAKVDGKFDTRIKGYGLDLKVSAVANTVLKEPKVGKNIPTVASACARPEPERQR